MSAQPQFSLLAAIKAVAQYENVSLDEADRLLSGVLPTPVLAGVANSSSPVNWSSIIRGIIASSGKFSVGKDIRQWLGAFVSNVELSSGTTIAQLPFEQVQKLLVQCVEPGVQVFIQGLKNVQDFKGLQSELYNKYGKSLRQVQFMLIDIEQGQDEPVADFFDRVDTTCNQADVSSEFLSGVIIKALLPSYRAQLASFETMASTSVGSKPITYEEIKSHLVKWEKNLVSTSGVPNVATVKAALEYPEHRGYNYNNRGRGGYYNQGNRQYRGGHQEGNKLPPPPPPPKQDKPNHEATANAIVEDPAEEDVGAFAFTLTDLACAQQAVEEAGISVGRLRQGLKSPDILAYSLEELVEHVGEVVGYAAAEDLAGVFLAELARVGAVNEVSPDIEEDDYELTQRTLRGGKVKQVKKLVRGGNVKELIRKLRASVPLTKYAALDGDVREYLLYTLIRAQAELGHELVVPDFLKRRILRPDEYEEYGAKVAGKAPMRYGVPITGSKLAGGQQGSKRSKPYQDMQVEPVEVPVQQVSHLSQLVGTRRQPGCTVMQVTPVDQCPLMVDAEDCSKLTPMSPEGQYLKVVLGGKKVNALYDTGSNCTIISNTLAKALNLPVQEYKAFFRQAAGVNAKFVGKLNKLKFQLHDAMELTVEGIRVMDTADDRLQFIVGTDVCAPQGKVVRERGTTMINGRKVLQMEIGTSGMVVDVPMVQQQGGSNGVSMVNVLENEGFGGECFAVSGGVEQVELGDMLVDKTQAWPLTQFSIEQGYDVLKCTRQLIEALQSGFPVLPAKCPACGHSCCSNPTRGPHNKHLCAKCKEWVPTKIPAVANPLAKFWPILQDGKVFFNALTFRP